MNKYLSFTPVDDELVKNILSKCPEGGDEGELCEILDNFLSLSEEVPEIAVSLLADSLAVRVFDGENYVFVSPIGLIDGWDIRNAVERIAEYSVREMIPLVFTDVPRECLDVYSDVFRMCDARVYDDDDDLFFVAVENECSFLDSVPTASDGELTLGEIKEEHLTEYARLCRDKELNKYWGYDVTEDNTLDTDEYFLDVVRREFNTCTAVTLGIYLGTDFIGEGVIYKLDYKGGASVGLRILPEYHNRGLGKRSFALLVEVARKMKLLTLRAEVMEENIPSIKMTSHFLDVEKREGGRVYFKKNI